MTIAFWSSTASHAQKQTDIDQIASTMVRLCVGGGRTETVSGGGGGSANVSLRSLDATGKVTGEFKISRSSAEGLVEGLNNAMNTVAADQADKVRVCLQPVRERLLDLLLPKKSEADETKLAYLGLVATNALGEWIPLGISINQFNGSFNSNNAKMGGFSPAIKNKDYIGAMNDYNVLLKNERSTALRSVVFNKNGVVSFVYYFSRPFPKQSEWAGRSDLCPNFRDKFFRIVSDLGLQVGKQTTILKNGYIYTARYLDKVEITLNDRNIYYNQPDTIEDCDQTLSFDLLTIE
jgi:hypothetical protein